MKPIFLFVLAFVSIAVDSYDLRNSEALFETYIEKYNKTYASIEEKQAKFENFKKQLEIINEQNAKDPNARYDINFYSDMNKNELLRKTTGFRVGLKKNNMLNNMFECSYQIIRNEPSVLLPESFDWRSRNGVTPIKNQRDCGSCWAFSTIANIESLYAIKHNAHLDLSEQHLVNCDLLNNGCNGGLMHWAMENILHEGGVVLESAEPYIGVDSVCSQKRYAVSINGCIRFNLLNENRLKELLIANGPISLAIDVIDLINYKSGVVHECGNSGLNHAVLLVGYGVQNNVPYWIIKNSWGEDYGEQGYVRVQRNINACGMLNEFASSVIL